MQCSPAFRGEGVNHVLWVAKYKRLFGKVAAGFDRQAAFTCFMAPRFYGNKAVYAVSSAFHARA